MNEATATENDVERVRLIVADHLEKLKPLFFEPIRLAFIACKPGEPETCIVVSNCTDKSSDASLLLAALALTGTKYDKVLEAATRIVRDADAIRSDGLRTLVLDVEGRGVIPDLRAALGAAT